MWWFALRAKPPYEIVEFVGRLRERRFTGRGGAALHLGELHEACADRAIAFNHAERRHPALVQTRPQYAEFDTSAHESRYAVELDRGSGRIDK